jgi:hypothetical protein
VPPLKKHHPAAPPKHHLYTPKNPPPLCKAGVPANSSQEPCSIQGSG